MNAVIPSAIPNIERQTSQEFERTALNTHRSRQSANILGDIVVEYHVAHRRFAGAAAAH